MADKVQNVVVNFKFNTAELEKATQLTNRANDAANKLQNTAEKAGKKLDQSFRQPIQSIGAMQIQLARLKSIIEVSSDPTKVKRLSDQYKQLKTDLDRATKAAFDNSKALKEVAAQGSSVSKIIGNVGNALSLAFSAAVVKQIVDVSLSLATLQGNAEGVGRAFGRVIPNSVLLLDDLRKATRGTITDFELMQRTLLATNLGVGAESLPKIFEFVATRVQQTGQNLDVLLDKFIRGIGVKSPRLLDDLGISSIRLKEKLDGVALSAVSIGDFTKIVGDIAQEELGKMGGYSETAATKVEQIKVALHDLSLEFAQASKPANDFFLRMIRNAIEGAKVLIQIRGNILKFGDQLLENEQKIIALQDAQRVRERAETDKSLQDQQKRFDFIQQEINSRVQILNTYQQERRLNTERVKLLEKSADGSLSLLEQAKLYNRENEAVNVTIGDSNILNRQGQVLRKQLVGLAGAEIPKLEATNKALSSNEKIVQETISLLKQYLNTVDDITKKEDEQLGIIEEKKDKIEKIQEAIEKTRKSSDLSSRLGVGQLITDLAVAQSELNELLNGPENKSFKIDTKPIKDAVKDFEKLIELVKGIDLGGIVIKPGKVSLEKNEVSVRDPILVRLDNVKLAPPAEVTIEDDFWDELGAAINEERENLADAAETIVIDQLVSIEEAEVASLQNRLNNLRNYYDEQQILAGDNDRAKQQLRLKEERETAALQKKIAQKQKEAQRFSIIVNTAAGIVRAFAESPFPLALVQSGIIAALGLSQLAIVNRTQARFAKGVINLKGPGTGTSDSINARVSKGESVMTAKETQNSMGILKDIRARRLDDKVLKDLKLSSSGVTYTGMDDSRIVKEIQELKAGQPDIIEQSGKLYKQYTKGKNYKVKLRMSAMGY